MEVKFSFIIPTLNEGKYIEDCIKSIKLQSVRNYEIIVVDSDSSDNTKELAQKMGACVLNEKRKGPAAARNAGAAMAKGSVFIFADADVRFEKNFLKNMEKISNFGGCIFHLHAHDANSFGESLSYEITNYIVRLMIALGKPMTAGSCFAYRADIFRESGGFDPRFVTNEDHELAKRVSKHSRFVFADIHVYTSARRAKKVGLFHLVKTYAKSTFMFLLNNKPIHDYWETSPER